MDDGRPARHGECTGAGSRIQATRLEGEGAATTPHRCEPHLMPSSALTERTRDTETLTRKGHRSHRRR
jgi:hypothetical protein